MEIIKAGPNTAAYPMNPRDMEQIKAWMHGVAAAAAQNETNNVYTNFKGGPFNSWWLSYDAGRAEEPPPPVPSGFDAQMSDDGLGFDLIPSGDPSGPVPPFKKRVTLPSTPGLGPDMRGGGGTPRGLLIAKVGEIVTQQDGTRWVRVS